MQLNYYVICIADSHDKMNWRWLLAFSSVPAFALLFFYTLVPESPRFLCMKGNTIDAHHILEKIARLNRTEIPSGMFVSNAKERQDEEFDPTEETHLLSSTKKKPDELKKGLSLFFILFSSSLARTTLLLWLLYFGIDFLYYGIIFLTTELSSVESKCGSTKFHLENLQDNSLYINAFITSLAGNLCLVSTLF